MNKKFSITKLTLLHYSMLCALCVFFQIIMSNQVNEIIDDSTKSAESKSMLTHFIIAVLSILIYQGFLIVKNKIANKIIKEKIILLKKDLFQSFYQNKAKSKTEYISLFCNDIPLIEENYYMAILNKVDMMCIVLMISIALIMINWIVFLIILLLTIVNFCFNIFAQKQITRSVNLISSFYNDETAILNNYFDGFSTIKSMKVESVISSLYGKTCNLLENSKFKYQLKVNILSNVYEGMSFLNIIIITLVGSFLILQKLITLGDLINVTILANMFFVSLPGLLMSSLNIKSTEILWKKIYKNIENQKTEFIPSGPMKAIEITNLSVIYNEKTILDNFSYTIHRGDKICIVGKNGSGKSTLVNCICQLNEYAGTISYNYCTDIINIDIFEHISYVSQKPFIFSDSLNFNVFLGKKEENIDMLFFEKLLNILELSKLFKERDNEKNSLNDENLSGGERQKIALLRVLVTDPEIIILDEALSMVDTTSRFKILEFLTNQKYTIIYITHNPKEITFYDKVINFDNFD